MIDFDKVPMKYWDMSTKISYLQRRVIIYSIMYYELNESCIADKRYDSYARQLSTMQNENMQDAERSQYWYCMKDFDPSTGFDLPYKLNEHDKEFLTGMAKVIIRMWRESNAKSKGRRTTKCKE